MSYVSIQFRIGRRTMQDPLQCYPQTKNLPQTIPLMFSGAFCLKILIRTRCYWQDGFLCSSRRTHLRFWTVSMKRSYIDRNHPFRLLCRCKYLQGILTKSQTLKNNNAFDENKFDNPFFPSVKHDNNYLHNRSRYILAFYLVKIIF